MRFATIALAGITASCALVAVSAAAGAAGGKTAQSSVYGSVQQLISSSGVAASLEISAKGDPASGTGRGEVRYENLTTGAHFVGEVVCLRVAGRRAVAGITIVAARGIAHLRADDALYVFVADTSDPMTGSARDSFWTKPAISSASCPQPRAATRSSTLSGNFVVRTGSASTGASWKPRPLGGSGGVLHPRG